MRAKKVDADSVVVYSTNELLKEVYGYYFFKKSKEDNSTTAISD
jgi:hypothetical protein